MSQRILPTSTPLGMRSSRSQTTASGRKQPAETVSFGSIAVSGYVRFWSLQNVAAILEIDARRSLAASLRSENLCQG